jgi:competence protein ComEC
MPDRLYKIFLILGCAAILIITPIFYLISETDKNLEVYFLDVGQGDSILIKTPYGQNILVDGGPDDTVLKRLGKEMSPLDKKIDLMILTHPHADHLTGLIDVIKNYKVEKILYTGVVHIAPQFLEWLKTVKDHRQSGASEKIPLTIIDRPQTIDLGEKCELQIMYPFKSFAGESVSNLNNSSIVFKLVYNQTSFLFMGDAEKEVEDELVKSGIPLGADVLKIGHHGSSDATSEEFLNEVKPKFAVIEVGRGNDFGHPSGRIIKRLERFGAKIFRTDLDGTVHLTSDGKRVKLE